MRTRGIISVLVILTLTLAGCGSTPVADDLAQREANEIIAVLRERGIGGSVSKGRGSGRYSVSVASGKYGEAAAILSRLGLPGERKPSFQEMTATNGIIPSSRAVENLRLDRALAAQIEELLQARSDVYSASAVVRRHVVGNEKPSVSVIVQRRMGATLTADEVREICEHSVLGVGKDDVFVSISDAQRFKDSVNRAGHAGDSDLVPFLIVWQVPRDHYNSLAGALVVLMVIVSASAGLAGYIIGQFSAIRRDVKSAGRSVNAVAAARDSAIGLVADNNEEA
jgi:type III secretory pathway lipoprotein EscJ